MTLHSERAAYIAWAVLMVSTLLSWLLAADHGEFFSDRLTTGSVVIAIAFIKIYLVGRYFMELRFAPTALRFGFNLWSLATCALVIALYASA